MDVSDFREAMFERLYLWKMTDCEKFTFHIDAHHQVIFEFFRNNGTKDIYAFPISRIAETKDPDALVAFVEQDMHRFIEGNKAMLPIEPAYTDAWL